MSEPPWPFEIWILEGNKLPQYNNSSFALIATLEKLFPQLKFDPSYTTVHILSMGIIESQGMTVVLTHHVSGTFI